MIASLLMLSLAGPAVSVAPSEVEALPVPPACVEWAERQATEPVPPDGCSVVLSESTVWAEVESFTAERRQFESYPIYNARGNGQATTEPIDFPEEWELEWRSDGGFTAAHMVGKGGRMVESVFSSQGTRGRTRGYKSGLYALEVYGGSWEIVVRTMEPTVRWDCRANYTIKVVNPFAFPILVQGLEKETAPTIVQPGQTGELLRGLHTCTEIDLEPTADLIAFAYTETWRGKYGIAVESRSDEIVRAEAERAEAERIEAERVATEKEAQRQADARAFEQRRKADEALIAERQRVEYEDRMASSRRTRWTMIGVGVPLAGLGATGAYFAFKGAGARKTEYDRQYDEDYAAWEMDPIGNTYPGPREEYGPPAVTGLAVAGILSGIGAVTGVVLTATSGAAARHVAAKPGGIAIALP